MISDEVCQAFDDGGGVTIDTPLTPERIAAASAALDRMLPLSTSPDGRPLPARAYTGPFYEPELLEILQDPFFEAVAQRVLRAPRVEFFQATATVSFPEPDRPFSFWQHVDIRYGLDDFQSTPRRVVCSFFLWLTDVNARRAPLMFRPGSHRLLAEDWDREHPELKGSVPMVRDHPLSSLPALDYADPAPLLAKAGQVSVLTTAAVHGASTNVDETARKVMVMTYTAEGVEIGLPVDQRKERVEYNRELRRLLRPDRAHIIPDRTDPPVGRVPPEEDGLTEDR